MTTLTIHGEIYTLGTHLIQWGVARVLDGTIEWTRTGTPTALVHTSLTPAEVAAALTDWAKMWINAPGWVGTGQRTNGAPPPALGTTFNSASFDKGGWTWNTVYAERAEIIDGSSDTLRETIAGVGQPTYWSGNGTHPLAGRSPMMMSPISGGKDWLEKFFQPWVEALPTSPTEILDALTTGHPVIPGDPGFGGAVTAVGGVFAIEGMAVLPLSRRVHRPTMSPSAVTLVPRSTSLINEVHVPLFTHPVTPHRVTTVLRDAAWAPARTEDHVTWLHEQGVTHEVTFPTVDRVLGPQASRRVAIPGSITTVELPVM